MTGNVKDILATAVGAFAFNDFNPTPFSVSGIAISFVGAAAFSLAKVKEMMAMKLKAGASLSSPTKLPTDKTGINDKPVPASHVLELVEEGRGDNACGVDGVVLQVLPAVPDGDPISILRSQRTADPA